MIEQTIALRKIAAIKKRIRGIQGGQGAAKTFSIMILIINHCSAKSNKQAYVISSELTKMRDTVVKDTITILQGFNVNCKVTGADSGQAKIVFPNGSFIRFIGMDKDDLGKGLRSDIMFVNEANKISFEAYREATSRAKNVFIDFNPNADFWFHKEVKDREDCEFLKLTFEDNEYLDPIEIKEILYYYKKGYGRDYDPLDPERNNYPIVNKYWANKWRVYGLGLIGSIDGVVFEDWEEVDELPEEARLLYYGGDFGYSVSKFAVAAIYQYNGHLYLRQIAYKNDLTNPNGAKEMIKNGYEDGALVYFDSAEPKSIQEMCDNGINAVACGRKSDIKSFAIQKLNSKKFYVVSDSPDLIEELQYYVWDEKTGKPKKTDKDHLMDGLLYGVGSEGLYSGSYL